MSTLNYTTETDNTRQWRSVWLLNKLPRSSRNNRKRQPYRMTPFFIKKA
jgi:hypothetical protein